MKGALVFIAVFAIAMVITLGSLDISPGREIYDAIGGEETDHQILGVEVPTLISASFNGIFYGIIEFVVYSLAAWTGVLKRRKRSRAVKP
ncbi:MAG: hypothetical protein ACLFSM_08210 [Thermoplasmata archaeon]